MSLVIGYIVLIVILKIKFDMSKNDVDDQKSKDPRLNDSNSILSSALNPSPKSSGIQSE